MDRSGGDDEVDLLTRRVDVVEALVDAPLHKPALVEAVDASRSTVDRAVRELERADLVERTDEGFRATLAGRLAAERYRRFLAEERDVLDGTGFLRLLPVDVDLPLEAVRESRTETFENPTDAFEATAEPLRTADHAVAFLPELRDSRYLRLLHARARGDGMTGELFVTERLLARLRAEFPRLTADLATAEGVSVRRVEDPGSGTYALFLSEGSGTVGGTASTVSVVAGGDVTTGVLTTEAPSAVEWAESTLADLRSDAADVTDDLAALVEDLGSTPLGRHERRGPADLGSIGVERIDRASLSRRPPDDPVIGWRVGFDPVDVHYGHAFERHHHHHPDGTDPRTRSGSSSGSPSGATGSSESPGASGASEGEATRAVDHVVGSLADGTNVVVLGPQGTGKSTLCRQVACRWVEAGNGTVLYRATPADVGFDRPEPLLAALDDDDGHRLVVVEDGGRASTLERLAPVLERVRDDPEVSLLLESRTAEWPPDGTRPRVRGLLRETVTGYRLGRLSQAECRDAVETFEAVTGRTVPLGAGELFDTLSDGDGPGDCHLLGHLLVAHTTPKPWSEAASGPTGLDADARAAYEAVAPGTPDETTIPLEVGLLAAVVTVAGRAVTPATLHTVAVAHADLEADEAHRHVDVAVEHLRGSLLFDREGRDDPERTGAFRTQHPYWAARFLVAALDDGGRATVDAFERAISALFAAADDPSVRERIEAWFGRPVRDLDRFETGVDDAVVALFDAIRRYTSLVELFGTTEFSGIDLPAACSPEARLEARAARLYGWYKSGDLDRAEREAEGLLEAVERLPPDVDATAVRFVARARRRLADVADDRGDAETAREHLRAGLSAVREGAEPRPRAETRLLTSLGMVELHADAYDDAEEYLREADRVGESLGACPERSATLYYLGRLHRKRGEYAAAEERLEAALAVDRQCEALPPSDAAATLNALGTVAVDREAHERAESYYRRALERQREANNRRGVATTLVNLGDLAIETDDVDVAASCFEEALDIAAEVGVAVVHGAALSGLGRVAMARGDLEEAEAYHRERPSVDGSPRSLAIAERYLGHVATERGDHEAARTHYERAAESFVDLGAVDRAAATALDLVEACTETGARADARSWLDRVSELAENAGLEEYRDAAATWDERLATN